MAILRYKNLFGKIVPVLFPISVLAQGPLSKNYPVNYFSSPLHIPISLAANFGELRQNHYHMGLDIRTERRENLPVYAAADGYVARVKVEPFGFGQAIYINHPNGYTTVYAHLNEFYPALAAYVKKQQYAQKSWKIMLDIPANLLVVKKGSLIAYSGNTGGSQGPHLHFEIRKTAEDVNLNPLLFKLPVADHVPPVIQRLALYDAARPTYEQSPLILPVHRSGNRFALSADTLYTSYMRAGLAISAFDTQSGSTNPNGIFSAALSDNDQPLIRFEMDDISYEYTRGINAHIDYRTRANHGPWLQQLFHLPGYAHSIYHPEEATGFIDLGDGAAHTIRITVSDANGNSSTLRFVLVQRGQPPARSVLPGKMAYPGMLNVAEQDNCAFYIGEKCLYDSVRIAYTETASGSPALLSAEHRIGNRGIPLADAMLVRIKPQKTVDTSTLKQVLMERVDGEDQEVQAVEWQGGWASARFWNFGTFRLVLDNEPPTINLTGTRKGYDYSQATSISFVVRDNYKALRRVVAELDGQWLRFSNDKEKAFIYRIDEHCPPGRHQLRITAEDLAGNVTVKTVEIIR